VEGLTAAVFLLVAVAVAFLVQVLLRQVVLRLTARTATRLDEMLVEALRVPLGLAIGLLGLYLALIRLSPLQPHIETIRTFFIILGIALGVFVTARTINILLAWYGQEIATRTRTDIDVKLLPVARRVVFVVVYGAGLILILDRLGIEISPLIAGLGIGGLAVALALQPTLSNFFAGTYVLSDAVIRPGDYIELDSGQAGYVREIGWRTTKIETWQGNLVVMPNSKLAEAIVVDYDKPQPSMLFLVTCGVSYESDLEKVEQIALEAARKAVAEDPEAPKDFDPVLRFREFADFNINFILVLKAKDRLGQFSLGHRVIKELHRRFQEEGIEINYPARKLYFADKTPTFLVGQASTTELTPPDPGKPSG
jgi:small-conductance mechanosensitive channel